MLNLKQLILTSAAVAMITAALTGCETHSGSGSASSGRSEGRAFDDKQITAEIKDRLENDPTYRYNEVMVKTFSGVVQLSGFANTESQKRHAGDIARRVQGVSDVVNNITLKPNLPPTGPR